MSFLCKAVAGSAALLILAGAVSGAELVAQDQVLRIAADPNNLPFTNDRLEGFENRLAEVLARELNARVEYTWWPQRRGFIRNTITEGTADVVLGVPAGYELVLTTRPYYRSIYAFAYRKDSPVKIASLDDEQLRHVRVGVQMIGDDFMNSPPAHALSRRQIIHNVRGYMVYGDYSEESPPSQIVRALASGEVDVAVAWGPMIGYFARRQPVELEVVPVSPESDGRFLPFAYSISVGVRKGKVALRDALDEVLERRREEIDGILAAYDVPRLPIVLENRVNRDKGGAE